MSNPNIEQAAAAQKASAEIVMALMRTSFEGMQRLAELNMTASRELFSSTVATTSKLASSRDIGDMARVNQQMAKPDRMMEYWRKVYDLVSQMQKDVTAVMQSNYSQYSKTAASAIDKTKSSATDGSDVFADAMKSMLERTNKAFDNMTAVAEQMANLANANMEAATAATAKAVSSVTDIAAKK